MQTKKPQTKALKTNVNDILLEILSPSTQTEEQKKFNTQVVKAHGSDTPHSGLLLLGYGVADRIKTPEQIPVYRHKFFGAMRSIVEIATREQTGFASHNYEIGVVNDMLSALMQYLGLQPANFAQVAKTLAVRSNQGLTNEQAEYAFDLLSATAIKSEINNLKSANDNKNINTLIAELKNSTIRLQMQEALKQQEMSMTPSAKTTPSADEGGQQAQDFSSKLEQKLQALSMATLDNTAVRALGREIVSNPENLKWFLSKLQEQQRTTEIWLTLRHLIKAMSSEQIKTVFNFYQITYNNAEDKVKDNVKQGYNLFCQILGKNSKEKYSLSELSEPLISSKHDNSQGSCM